MKFNIKTLCLTCLFMILLVSSITFADYIRNYHGVSLTFDDNTPTVWQFVGENISMNKTGYIIRVEVHPSSGVDLAMIMKDDKTVLAYSSNFSNGNFTFNDNSSTLLTAGKKYMIQVTNTTGAFHQYQAISPTYPYYNEYITWLQATRNNASTGNDRINNIIGITTKDYFMPTTINSLNITAQYSNYSNTTDLAYWDAQNLICQANVSGSEYYIVDWFRNEIKLNYSFNSSSNMITDKMFKKVNFGIDDAGHITEQFTTFTYYYQNNSFINKIYNKIYYGLSNLTYLNINQSCLDYYEISKNISIRIFTDSNTGFHIASYPQCYDGTNWITIGDVYNKTGNCAGYDYSLSVAKNYILDDLLSTGSNPYDQQYYPLNSICEDALYYEANAYNTSIAFLPKDFYSLNDNISCQVTAFNGTFNTSSSRNITIQPPLLSYINLLKSSTMDKQNITCNYSITHPDTNNSYWLVNNTIVKYGNLFQTSDFLDSYLGLPIKCAVNITSGTYNNINYSEQKIVGQNITFSAGNRTGGSISNYTITSYYSSWNISNVLTIFGYNTTYEYIFTHPLYAITKVNLTLNVLNQSYNFSVLNSNSINMTFKDESTLTLITENITVEFITTTGVYYNYTTETGNLYVEYLEPKDYTIRYSANNYATNYYSFTLTNQTTIKLNLYMASTTITSNVTAYVYNIIGNTIENARIKVMKEQMGNASNFILVQTSDTNFEGKTQLSLELSTKYYMFIIEYPIGTTVLTTTKTYIYTSPISFTINPSSNVADILDHQRSVLTSLTFDNITDTFTYVFTDEAGLVSQGCLYISTINILGKSDYSNSCVASSSGVVSLPIIKQNGTTFLANAFIYYAEDRTLTNQLSISYEEPENKLETGNNGIYLMILIMLTLVGLGLWNPIVAVVLFPFPITFFKVLGLIELSWAVIVPLHIVSFIIVYLMSDRS